MVGRELIWVLPLTAFVAMGTFFSGGGRESAGGELRVAMLLAAVAVLLLLLSRRAPMAVLLTVAGIVGLYFGLGLHDGPVYLPLFLASFLACTHGSLRRWIPVVAAALALVLVGLAIRGATTDVGWWQPFWQAIGTSALTVAAGLLGGLAHSRRQTAHERVVRAATEEKLRMAHDLHDGVGHGLAVIAMQAGVALHVLEKDPQAVRRALEAIRDTSKESLDALRSELSVLAGESAAPSPRRGLADLPALISRVQAAGVDVRRSGTVGGALPDDVDAAAYAVVQEALTNVLRHAGATAVELDVDRVESTLSVSVVDNGHGGEVHDEGMGLSGMRERVTALGGTVSAQRQPDRGFEVRAVIPVSGP